MTCDDIRDLLDAYRAKELEPAERAVVANHLASCAGCRAEALAWSDLFDRTAALPRSIEPPRDLWPAVDAALDPPAKAVRLRPRARSRSLLLVAAGVALVVVTAGVTSLLQRDWDTAMARKLKGLQPPAGTEVGPEATTEDLLRALEAQDLPPETMAIVQRNLAVIDVAIAELETALEQDPDNDELARMLVSVHRKKAELVEGAARAREGG
jgi:hypothetical protein